MLASEHMQSARLIGLAVLSRGLVEIDMVFGGSGCSTVIGWRGEHAMCWANGLVSSCEVRRMS